MQFKNQMKVLFIGVDETMQSKITSEKKKLGREEKRHLQATPPNLSESTGGKSFTRWKKGHIDILLLQLVLCVCIQNLPICLRDFTP